MATNNGVGALAGDEKLAADAYARVTADMAALAPEQVSQVNLDIQVAAGTVLGVLPEVKALRDRMAKELPAFDLAAFDKLEDYVLALTFAQGAFQTATLPPDDLQELATEAASLRERLLADARALALHGLFDSRKLDQLKGANGNKNVAQDLQMLSQAFQESWPQIQGKSATVAEDLQTASRVGTRLTRVLGLREQGPALLADATDKRMRAFTLMIRTYEEARAAVGYLHRHDGDADAIAPNLYAGNARRRSTGNTPADPTQPVQAPAATGTAPAPVAGTTATTATSPGLPPAAVAAAIAAQKGAPASKDPFLS